MKKSLPFPPNLLPTNMILKTNCFRDWLSLGYSWLFNKKTKPNTHSNITNPNMWRIHLEEYIEIIEFPWAIFHKINIFQRGKLSQLLHYGQHRITGWLKLEGISEIPKQGQAKHVVWDHVQTTFECLQGWRLHNLPGQSVPVLSILTVGKKTTNKTNDLSLDRASSSFLLTGHPWKGFGSIFTQKWDPSSPTAFSSMS